MKMNTKFQMAEAQIYDGEREEAEKCPVALCLQDAGLVDAEVTETELEGGYEVYARIEGIGCVAELPDEVSAFVKAYDKGGIDAVTPICFEIDQEAWSGYYFCPAKGCSDRVAVPLAQILDAAEGLTEFDPVVLEWQCPLCRQKSAVVFRGERRVAAAANLER